MNKPSNSFTFLVDHRVLLVRTAENQSVPAVRHGCGEVGGTRVGIGLTRLEIPEWWSRKTERIQNTAHFFMDPELIARKVCPKVKWFWKITDFFWSNTSCGNFTLLQKYVCLECRTVHFSPNLMLQILAQLRKKCSFVTSCLPAPLAEGPSVSDSPKSTQLFQAINQIMMAWMKLAILCGQTSPGKGQERSSAQFWGAPKVSDVLFGCFSQNGCRTCQS